MMKPLNNYIVAKLIDTNKKEESGLIIPDTAKKKPHTGNVLFVSENVKGIVSPGDIVVWPSMLGVETTIDDKDYIVLDIKDILLILNKK